MSERLTAASYSRLRDYEGCPRKAKYKYIDKLPDPGNAAMDRGTLIHSIAEDFITGVLRSIPAEIKILGASEPNPMLNLKKEYHALKTDFPKGEQQWAFNKGWGRCDWMAPDVMLRIKVDAVADKGKILRIIDHKTGKVRDDYQDQADLYALGGFLIHTKVQRISAEFMFVDAAKIKKRTYLRSELSELKERWEERLSSYFNDTTFAVNPSMACRWCPYSKSKKMKTKVKNKEVEVNGPCKH